MSETGAHGSALRFAVASLLLTLSTHASDQGGAPVAKKVMFTKEQLFGNHRQHEGLRQAQPVKAPVASQGAILGTPGAMPDLGRIQARIEAIKARTA